MASNVVHLPDGQTLTTTPVFGGMFFKFNELTTHTSVFPAGWTIILQSEDYSDEHASATEAASQSDEHETGPQRHRHIHKYSKPTLQDDNLFISSISNPSTHDFNPPTSPTRQIALMLWATLYWYFHQDQPHDRATTEASKNTPEDGKPRGEWKITIKREGVFRGKNLMQKLERMGLLISDNSSVGTDSYDEDTWFITRQSFWQLSPKIFLFTLVPAASNITNDSRPSSPPQAIDSAISDHDNKKSTYRHHHASSSSPGLWAPSQQGPFTSGSHLPTYFPPPPLRYTISNGVRHPSRPKPAKQGEMVYTRYVSSVGQYLSFRVASLSPKPVEYTGPLSSDAQNVAANTETKRSSTFGSKSPTAGDSQDTLAMSDVELLHKWMNDPRVSKFWGCAGPSDVQEKFLRGNLESKHSLPVIGMWDGKPFGYFEIYWVKEDILGKLSVADDYDRGVHVIVGEQEFRGKHRLQCWMSALVHYMFLEDYRTNSVVLEPRIDNVRYVTSNYSSLPSLC